MRNLIFLIMFALHSVCIAQSQQVENTVFSSKVASVQMFPSGQPLQSPIIQLLGGTTMSVHFDYLDSEISDMRYEIQLCTKHWVPVTHSLSSYAKSLGTHYFDTIQNWVNTHVPYVHYSTSFPYDDFEFLLSGNYIFRVFNDYTNELLFQLRFMVIEQLVELTTNIRAATNVMYRDTHQEVDVDVHLHGFKVHDPVRDMYLVYMQNGRWDNAIHGLKPSFISADKLQYDYERENLFEAGAEYHHFSCKNIYAPHVQVNEVFFNQSQFELSLKPHKSETYSVYASRSDLNGRFLPSFERPNDAHTDADYVRVNFILNYPNTFAADSIDMYVCGHFNMWQTNEANRMTYNFEKKQFEASLILKQGYYDYLFAYRDKRNYTLQTFETMGSFSQTKNEYEILVYFYDMIHDYDRIIGYTRVLSEY